MKLLSILMLMGVILLSSTGCSKEHKPRNETFYVLKCDRAKNQLQLFSGLKTTEDDGEGEGTISTGLEQPVGSPLNGKPCSVSEENLGEQYTIADGYFGSESPDVSLPLRKAVGPAQVDAVTTAGSLFPWLQPVLFAFLPPIADPRRLPQDCPANYGGMMVNHRQNTVTVFRTCPQLRQLKEITVYRNPLQVAVTPDGAQALVTSYGDSDGGALTFIDSKTLAVTATLRMFNYNPAGIAISPDGQRAYLTHYYDLSPSLVVVDVPGRKVLSTIPLPLQYPRSVVLTPDGTQAWVNYYQGGIVTVVDLLTGTIGGTVTITQQVSTGIAFNPTGTKAFVASQPNLLHVVDTATLRVITRIVVGQEPTDVVLTKDGETVLVNSDVDPGTWWIDARTNKLVTRTKAADAGAGGTMGLLVFQ